MHEHQHDPETPDHPHPEKDEAAIKEELAAL